MNHLTTTPRRENVELFRLRPTQLTVGMLEVKRKRRRLRKLEKQPAELVDFILEMPIRVVWGPGRKAYVIDHHHLGLALIKENFITAPMVIEDDFSNMGKSAFWKRMQASQFLHLYDETGAPQPLNKLPKCLEQLEDDPYRSLAGFVRSAGGFAKTLTPFAEFQWADFFRTRIGGKALRKRFEICVQQGIELAHSDEAAGLPGYLGNAAKGKEA